MKKLRMLTSILVAIVLCVSFFMPTLANAADGAIGAEEEKCSITISGQVTGHKFVAYRMFKADLNVVGGVKTLSNIEFSHTDEQEAKDFLDELNTVFERTETNAFKTAAEVADYLSALTGDERQPAAVKFAKAANGYVTSVDTYDLTESTVGTDTVYSVSNIKPGYYLIIDKNVGTVDPEDSIYSRFILEVAGDVEATAKIEGQPVLGKEVGKKDGDGNIDYTPAENMDKQHNTANVGDSIPFKLDINFPNLAEYSSYKFVVTDTLSTGLTFDKNVTMKIINGVTSEVDGETVTSDMTLVPDIDFTVVESTEKPGEITIDFKTIFAKYTADPTLVGKTIIIEYSATLNDNANVDGTANTNTAKLTYSNDPRTTDSVGTTPEKTTETYTYKVTINKVDIKNKDAAWGNVSEPKGSHVKTEGALSDVEFTLHRVTSAPDAVEETSVEIPGTYKTNANGQIEIPGLANGTYYLIETVAHPGYNKVLGKIHFTISAKYNETTKRVEIGTDDIKADADDDVKNEATIGVVPLSYENNPTVTFDSEGELWLLVTNSTGAQLPSTGGVGTVIFTVVGILVMAAVVVIAVKSNKK